MMKEKIDNENNLKETLIKLDILDKTDKSKSNKFDNSDKTNNSKKIKSLRFLLNFIFSHYLHNTQCIVSLYVYVSPTLGTSQRSLSMAKS